MPPGSTFLKANPGRNNILASNIALQGQLMDLLSKKGQFSDEELDRIFETLKYRLDALAQSDALARIMCVGNKNFDAYSFDHDQWKRSKEEDYLAKVAWRLLLDKKIVERPVESHFWLKPLHTLCTCLATAGLHPGQIKHKVAIAENHKQDQARAISELNGSQITRDEEVIRCRDMFLNKMKSPVHQS